MSSQVGSHPVPPRNDLASLIVAIVGGDTESLTQILASLPGRTGAAFVVRAPHDTPDGIETRLERRIPMPVVRVATRRRLRPDRVHVVPRDNTPHVCGGVIALSAREEGSDSASVAPFLQAFARHCGPRAIAIVLASEGAVDPRVLEGVRAHGTTVIGGNGEPANGSIPEALLHALDRARCDASRLDETIRRTAETNDRRRSAEFAALMAAIVRSSQVAIVGKTLDGVITSWNEGAENLYGYRATEMIGAPIFHLVPPDRRDELDGILSRLRRGERVESLETIRIAKDGAALRVMLSISPVLDSEGTVTGASAIAYDVTARHQALRALERSENDLSDFFENASIAIHWVGPDGTILRANRAELEMLGYDESEYVGRHISEFYSDPVAADAVLHRLQRHETLHDYEVALRCKDGSTRIGLVTSNVRWEGDRFVHTRCFTRDITEQKRAQHDLQESEERLGLALEAGCMGTWEWELDTNQVRWSKSLAAMHGLAPGSCGGRFEDFRHDIHPDDEDRVIESIQNALDRVGDFHIEYRVRLPESEIAWLEARGRVIAGIDAKPARVLGLCMDITRRKRADALLEQTSRRKDEFLALLGHELRNPLAPILNSMHLLRTPSASHEQKDAAWRMMERQVTYMSRLVDDLLDVSRITRGEILLNKERIDLSELVRETFEDHRSALEAQDLRTHIRTPSLPVMIDGDAMRLRQALGNLLQNARKFTPRGGTVSVSARAQDGMASVTIADDGLGIERELLERVFEPFSQADPGPDRSRGGLGLGLTLVKTMIESHGGTVEARSEGTGLGSEFTLKLPLATNTEPETGVELDAPPSEPLRVLVIEDHPDAAASMRMMLELEGHTVEVASDGASSFALARSFHPDVVLCDIGLPGAWDGYAVSRAFRSDADLKHVPLVALTGYGQSSDREKSKDAGFDAHLTKPVLYDTLRRVFAEVRSTSAPSHS